MTNTVKQIGEIGVDAGLCWIGDPCYILHAEQMPKAIGKDWAEFCSFIRDASSKPFDYDVAHPGLGVAVSTGFGDGVYRVFAEFDARGGSLASGWSSSAPTQARRPPLNRHPSASYAVTRSASGRFRKPENVESHGISSRRKRHRQLSPNAVKGYTSRDAALDGGDKLAGRASMQCVAAVSAKSGPHHDNTATTKEGDTHMTNSTSLCTPWSLHFDRDGTEDYGMICDAER